MTAAKTPSDLGCQKHHLGKGHLLQSATEYKKGFEKWQHGRACREFKVPPFCISCSSLFNHNCDNMCATARDGDGSQESRTFRTEKVHPRLKQGECTFTELVDSKNN